MNTFVGIDVAKDHLDIAASGGQTWRFAYNAEGIEHLIGVLHPLKPQLLVVEATGGLEHAVAAALSAAGFALAVVNPRQVRDFARATGQLAKTDAIDAAVLALFAERIRPEVRALPDEQQRLLAALVARRRQLSEMLVQERNRLHTATGPVRADVETHIAFLESRMKATEEQARTVIAASPAWRADDTLFRSVPGVGPVVSATLVAELPELGQLSHKEIAALVGVAPFNCDSGRQRGQRVIWGGRASVRCALYMATLSGVRYNEALRAHYQGLVARGKAKGRASARPVALVAWMRKLLIWLNAMARDRQPWNVEIHLAAS